MDGSVWNDDELGTYNLPPLNEINPSQDFNLQQEDTDPGPLQDLNPQQETPEPELLPPHVETNHGHQLNQAAERSPEPSRRGRRAKLSDFQRKLNKKMSDQKHRQKLKDNMANLIKEKEKIEKEATDMKVEKEQIKLESELQKKYIQHLVELIKALKSQSDVWMTDVEGQSDEMIKELLECQPCNATVPAAAAEFYKKLEENEGISLDFKDFRDLHEKQEYRTVGKYQIPLSLVPTAEKITEVYGDVCGTSTISRNFAENIYTLFCATIKEMDELPLEEVTEETMLKWRTAIKDALCIKFKVEFAMEHLKKTIAGRYFGMTPYTEAEKIDDEISKAEARLNGLKECKKFRDIAKEFDGKPLSEGLWG